MATYPDELTQRPQWVACKLTPSRKRPGKLDKLPIDPHTGGAAAVDNPATWGSLAQAQARKEQDRLGLVSFILSEADPYTGIDLDDCIPEGATGAWLEVMEPRARAIVEQLRSYTERSISGRGVKILVRATLPPGGRVAHKAGVEMYDAGRQWAMTGDVLPGFETIEDRQAEIEQLHAALFPPKPKPAATPAPRQPLTLSDSEIVHKMLTGKNGGRYHALWTGNTTEYASQSEADAALVNGLAFYSGGDPATVDRIFRQSALYRAKWDKHCYRDGTTYGEATIAFVLPRLTEFYSGNGHTPPRTDWEMREPPDWLETAHSDGPATVGATPAGQPEPEQPPRKPRYVLHRAVEAWEPRPPREWLLEGLIGAGDVVLLVGEPGVGKTYFFLDLGVQVATGRAFLDLATSSSPVLIVDEESGNRRLQDRLERIMRGRGIAPGSDIPLSYITMAGFSFLVDPMWFTDLELAIEETGARLVILDALADIMLTGDENAVRDAQPVFRGLKGVAEQTGATIVVVHHANRAGQYRGSSAIPGAVDLALQLSRKEKTGPVTVETTKARDIEPMKFTCRMRWDETTDTVWWERVTGEDATEPTVTFSNAERVVLRYLQACGGAATKPEIENNAGCTASAARHALYSLCDRHYLERGDSLGRGRGVAAVYKMSATGRTLFAETGTDKMSMSGVF